MDYIADAIPKILEREKSDEVFTESEIQVMNGEFRLRMATGEATMVDPETIAGRVVAMCLITRTIDPSTIDGKPFEIKLTKEGFKYGFMNKHEKCHKCTSEMMGRIHAYPPYCDSTYEEWSCPVCGKGGWGSSI